MMRLMPLRGVHHHVLVAVGDAELDQPVLDGGGLGGGAGEYRPVGLDGAEICPGTGCVAGDELGCAKVDAFIEGRDLGVLADGGGEDGEVEECGRAEWLAEDTGRQRFPGWSPESSGDVEHELAECADSDERSATLHSA